MESSPAPTTNLELSDTKPNPSNETVFKRLKTMELLKNRVS